MSEHFSHAQITAKAAFSAWDRRRVEACRLAHTQLRLAYQMAFVRLVGRFPTQQPLEVVDEILDFVSMEFELEPQELRAYAARQATVSEHCNLLRKYLRLKRFHNKEHRRLSQFLLEEASQLEQTTSLFA